MLPSMPSLLPKSCPVGVEELEGLERYILGEHLIDLVDLEVGEEIGQLPGQLRACHRFLAIRRVDRRGFVTVGDPRSQRPCAVNGWFSSRRVDPAIPQPTLSMNRSVFVGRILVDGSLARRGIGLCEAEVAGSLRTAEGVRQDNGRICSRSIP